MARKKQEMLALFPEVYTSTAKMSDAQFGELMRAIFAYRFENTPYSGDDVAVDMMFSFIKTQVDRYVHTCEVNRKNRSGDPVADCEEVQPSATESHEIEENPPPNRTHNPNRTHTHTHNHNHTHNPPPVSPPSDQGDMGEELGETYDEDIENRKYPKYFEVMEYCRGQGLNDMDRNAFYCHYYINGWKDKNGDPVRDWKALARSWNTHKKASPEEWEI